MQKLESICHQSEDEVLDDVYQAFRQYLETGKDIDLDLKKVRDAAEEGEILF